MKKFVIFTMMLTMMCLCFVNTKRVFASTCENGDEEIIRKYAESFLSKLFPDMNLLVTGCKNIYGRSDELNGYCCKLVNDGVDNGYPFTVTS